jgi:hypothetical protein
MTEALTHTHTGCIYIHTHAHTSFLTEGTTCGSPKSDSDELPELEEVDSTEDSSELESDDTDPDLRLLTLGGTSSALFRFSPSDVC